MSDPDSSSGSCPQPVAARGNDKPSTHLSFGKNSKHRHLSRHVSIVAAALQQGLRARIQSFLPYSLYKLVARIESVRHQRKLGRMIAAVREQNDCAWQKLGEGRSGGARGQVLRRLQLDCQQTQLWLDILEGRGASSVTADRARVVDWLDVCASTSDPLVFRAANTHYLDANNRLKISAAHEIDLKQELQAPHSSLFLSTELKQLEKMLVDEESAQEAYHRFGKVSQ